MAKDLLYFFDKKPTSSITSSSVTYNNVYKRYELGEVQQTFNMSFSINGDKDSVHFTVISYTYNEIEPFTILWHEKTNTWWCVSKDKTKRFANEIGYMYEHEIECVGAIELLNARELTDCGFRANKYTIAQFFQRLCKRSNFEFTPRLFYISDIKNNIVDYVKTFENYTLLSALREFFDGYNYSLKMEGVQHKKDSTNDYYLTTMDIYCYSKSGDTDFVININRFNDIRESRSLTKDSYGTKVISNARNVVSTKVSRFPAVGTTGLTSNDRLITENNGDTIPETSCIRLPEDVFKVNKVVFVGSYFRIWCNKNSSNIPSAIADSVYLDSTAYDIVKTNEAMTSLINIINTKYGQEVANIINGSKENIIKQIQYSTIFEFYNGALYDPISQEYKTTSECPQILQFRSSGDGAATRKIILADKATRDTLPVDGSGKILGVYWERGSNLIKGFYYFGKPDKYISQSMSKSGTHIAYQFTYNGDTYYIGCGNETSGTSDHHITFSPTKMQFIVEYIPMGNLKIDIENDKQSRDTKLYNQNGKLNDSINLSKLINSYKDEITHGNITRYGVYYSYDDIPQVGYIVNDNGTFYVINSVSIDFFKNENGYYMECEFQMSPQIAVKSLMVNANSNIRDYGIPQDYNVDRVQVYKDIYYITYDEITTYDSHYQFLNQFVSGKFVDDETIQYTAFIRTNGTFNTYTSGNENPTGTTSHYYYKLPVTRFDLKKGIIFKLNFHDNNIIGYDSQNVTNPWSPQNLLRLLSNQVNTPISYVDDYGCVDGFDIRFCNNAKTSEVFTNYATSIGNSDVASALYNAIFIGQDVYDLANPGALGGFELNEPNYDKDALEVPVFEYACQVLNSDSALIGENFFDTYRNYGYRVFYFYEYIDDDYVTEQSAMNYASENISVSGATLTMNNAVKITFGNYRVDFDFYNNATSILGATISYNTQVNMVPYKNIGIYRVVYDVVNLKQVKKELFVVLKKVPILNMPTNNRIRAYIGRKK